MDGRADTGTEVTFLPSRARIVSLRRGDVRLHGLLSEPEIPGGPRVGLVHVHGRGGSFYTRPGSTTLSRYPDRRIGHLSINLRAHDLGYTAIPEAGADPGSQDDYGVAGAMWERTADSAADIGIAVDALRDRGYTAVFVTAHSGAALPLAAYAADHPGLAGRILLSPLTSGKASLARWFGDEAGIEKATARAQKLVDEGRGHLLIPVDQWYYALSAASLLDRLAESDDAWQLAMESDDSPCLMVWGAEETRAPRWQQTFGALDVPVKRAVPIVGSGHYYVGFEDAITQAVAGFVAGIVHDTNR